VLHIFYLLREALYTYVCIANELNFDQRCAEVDGNILPSGCLSLRHNFPETFRSSASMPARVNGKQQVFRNGARRKNIFLSASENDGANIDVLSSSQSEQIPQSCHRKETLLWAKAQRTHLAIHTKVALIKAAGYCVSFSKGPLKKGQIDLPIVSLFYFLVCGPQRPAKFGKNTII